MSMEPATNREVLTMVADAIQGTEALEELDCPEFSKGGYILGTAVLESKFLLLHKWIKVDYPSIWEELETDREGLMDLATLATEDPWGGIEGANNEQIYKLSLFKIRCSLNVLCMKVNDRDLQPEAVEPNAGSDDINFIKTTRQSGEVKESNSDTAANGFNEKTVKTPAQADQIPIGCICRDLWLNKHPRGANNPAIFKFNDKEYAVTDSKAWKIVEELISKKAFDPDHAKLLDKYPHPGQHFKEKKHFDNSKFWRAVVRPTEERPKRWYLDC